MVPAVLLGTLSAIVALGGGTAATGGWTDVNDGLISPTGAAQTKASDPRLIMWVDCQRDVVPLTGMDLRRWRGMGVDGFVCMTGRLRGLGGDQAFTGNPEKRLSATRYELQRSLRNSRVVRRAEALGMKMYLGVYFSNYFNRATPLKEWFDRSGWRGRILPRLRKLAAAAKLLGFAGIAIDQEMYRQQGGARTATWRWDYPGNFHSETEVREKVRRRGAALMRAVLHGFPRAELAVYGAFFPGDWRELVLRLTHGVEEVGTDRVDVDLWNGMTSTEGYRAIRFFDSVFYKTPHLGNWENALAYNQNRVYATFSRRFSNWDHAWSRVHVSPFAWVDEGFAASAFDDARSPAYVAEQLVAFRRWSTGGEFANFAYRRLNRFDYSPYAEAMRDASATTTDDHGPPRLNVASFPRDKAVEGTAHDDLAIRAVRWRDDRGRTGTAELDWRIRSGDYDNGYEWETHWSVSEKRISRGATEIEVSAIDIKGNVSRTEAPLSRVKAPRPH